MKLKDIKIEKKFETLFEDTIYRFQNGGFLAGDIVKFKPNALQHEKVKGMSSQYQEMVKNAIETDLNLRLGAVKSIRPNTAGNYGATGTDAPADYFADIVVEYAPGLWRDPITVPLEVLEVVDTGINMAPVPDSLKRPSKSTKPEKVSVNDKDRATPTKNIVLPSKAPLDGRSGIKSPTPYKESAKTIDEAYQSVHQIEQPIKKKINETQIVHDPKSITSQKIRDFVDQEIQKLSIRDPHRSHRSILNQAISTASESFGFSFNRIQELYEKQPPKIQGKIADKVRDWTTDKIEEISYQSPGGNPYDLAAAEAAEHFNLKRSRIFQIMGW